MRKLALLVWKDVLGEVRGPERISTLVFFAAAVLLTLQFSVPVGSTARPLVAAGLLWTTLLFAGMLELRRSFESERRDGTLEGLRVSPLDPTLLFAGKLLSSLLVLSALATVLVPLTALFFIGSLRGVGAGIGVSVLGLVGLLGWGLLLAAMSGQTRSGEVVVPVLLFGLLVPQTIACVRLLAHYLAGVELDSPFTAFAILLGFDLLSVGTTVLLFDYAVEE